MRTGVAIPSGTINGSEQGTWRASLELHRQSYPSTRHTFLPRFAVRFAVRVGVRGACFQHEPLTTITCSEQAFRMLEADRVFPPMRREHFVRMSVGKVDTNSQQQRLASGADMHRLPVLSPVKAVVNTSARPFTRPRGGWRSPAFLHRGSVRAPRHGS